LNVFPGADPIPLPAPVWLFKLLSVVTLALHFVAMQFAIGGLTLATIWNALGKPGSDKRRASDSIIKKLPTVMIYVVNFGVPPLLFAQVLYGQALYTSSILIGAYWIAVIFLLIAAYYLLYLAADRAKVERSWWLMGLVSLVLMAYIGRIYSTNMTLMLRPDEWLAVYQASNARGTIMPSGDPTLLPRFLCMVVGSLSLGGAGVALIGGFTSLGKGTLGFLRTWGAAVAIVFGIAQAVFASWAFSVQPAVIQSGVLQDPLYYSGMIAWAGAEVFGLLMGALVLLVGKEWPRLTTAALFLAGFLSTISLVLVRDGIRDVSLQMKGLDIWQQPVVANWSVVILFLGLFVAGLALIGYMLYAVARSARQMAARESGILDAEELTEPAAPATVAV